MKIRYYFTKDPPRPGDYRDSFLAPDGTGILWLRFVNRPPKTYGDDIMEELENYSTVGALRIFLRIKGYVEVTEHYVKKLMVME